MMDIACIGGGPASAFAALEILKKGKNVEIFEEHKEIGVPRHCAGLISVSGFNKLGIQVPRELKFLGCGVLKIIGKLKF